MISTILGGFLAISALVLFAAMSIVPLLTTSKRPTRSSAHADDVVIDIQPVSMNDWSRADAGVQPITLGTARDRTTTPRPEAA